MSVAGVWNVSVIMRLQGVSRKGSRNKNRLGSGRDKNQFGQIGGFGGAQRLIRVHIQIGKSAARRRFARKQQGLRHQSREYDQQGHAQEQPIGKRRSHARPKTASARRDRRIARFGRRNRRGNVESHEVGSSSMRNDKCRCGKS